MALHGDVRVNGIVIMAWSARRLPVDEGNMTAIYEYEVEADWTDHPAAITRMWHVYADGAEALAAKVLTWAAEHRAAVAR